MASTSYPTAPCGDPLGLLGVAPAAARILRYFLIRRSAEPHVRELQRALRLGGASLQRELERLSALGAIERRADGRRVRYRAVPESPVWKAVEILEGVASDPTALIRDAVGDVSGVLAAFIFGSTAGRTQRDDSDIDLFVVEDPAVDRRTLLGQLAAVEVLLGREVDVVRYTPQALGERLGDASHPAFRFVREALLGPKQWVAGTAQALAPLAAAAGLPAVDAGRLPESE
jgi:predicted nucleotidyltransferase